MIQVGVCKEDCVNCIGSNRERLPISESERFKPLKQSAVDQHISGWRLEQKLGARYRSCSAKKLNGNTICQGIYDSPNLLI
jgi:hypothetical protein